jgi:N-methylhydantoinase A
LKPLSVELAREAVESSVATPLGLDVYRAAEAILTLANAKMAGTIRLVSIERGHDPRLFAYMPFGGGGALHVCALMREVGVSVGLIPRYPGVTSALGCVLSDMKHDAVQTLNKGLADLDIADLQEKVARLRQLCQARLDASGIVFTRIVETVVLDMLYQGQTHTVAVPIEADDYSHEGLLKAFERTYHAQFGRTLSGPAVRVLNLRYSRVGERAKFDLSILAPQSKVVPEVLGHERIFHQGEWLSVPRSARLDWPVGSKVVGPAMLEQADTTIWLEPGFQARVDEWGNLLLSRGETPA